MQNAMMGKNKTVKNVVKTVEERCLLEAREKQIPWKKWGPYLSERQWGTVREDYSESGTAWDYFTHDQARSRAYHWGEDGLAGVSDEKQRPCFALALWNGKDPILKERIFGLANSEGNHGEDVKEYYFYLDNTPTHSYMKYLYKYPQAAYPYDDLVRTNKNRSRLEFEYELMDTGVFDSNRYFDIFVEYAKETPEDILIKISICNRGPESATLHVLPTFWFRNTWSWTEGASKPVLRQLDAGSGFRVIEAAHAELGKYYLYCNTEIPILFTENETNNERIFGKPNTTPYVKDGINNYIVLGQKNVVNPDKTGTKASAHYVVQVAAGTTELIHLRLNTIAPDTLRKSYTISDGNPFGIHFDDVLNTRLREADEFYRSITPPSVGEDAARVMRQALAGMLWSKQYYYLDVVKWLKEHGAHPLEITSLYARNKEWFHMLNDDIISMPDKWEYPWYAAWDLAFHAVALSAVDLEFAKEQLDIVLREPYIHPSGQIPAYEWAFSDVNPPVHSWATLFLYNTDKFLSGKGDIEFLERTFGKLLLNFTWWVNRKDRYGKNIFEGGFLGLDNISVFDRSAPLPTGGYIEQADGSAWMALFCQNMCEMGIELATIHDSSYEGLVMKFVDHFLWIAAAINKMGGKNEGLWDEEDGSIMI